MCTDEMFLCFCDACARDQLEMARQLQAEEDIDIHGHLDLPLKTAVTYGATRVTRWLLESFTGYPNRLLADMILPRLCLSNRLDLCQTLAVHHQLTPSPDSLAVMIKESIVRQQISTALWLLRTFRADPDLLQDWVLPQATAVYNPTLIAEVVRQCPDLDPDRHCPGWDRTPRQMVPPESVGEVLLDGARPPGWRTRLARLWRDR